MLLCFDMVGDDVGWENALWVPVVFTCLLIAIRGVYAFALEYALVRPSLDTGMYAMRPSSPPSIKEIELGDATSVSVHNPLTAERESSAFARS
jgi:hypothetical protein